MLSVLIVDDELLFCEMMSDFLKKKGYKVRTSQSGIEALKLVEDEKPDIVLLDLLMPEMTGEAVLKELKKRYPDLPVLMVTVFSSEKKALELLRQGAVDYITKPIDFYYLEKYLSTWEKFPMTESSRLDDPLTI